MTAPNPPFFVSIGAIFVITFIFVLGKLRDLFSAPKPPRKGFAPIKDVQEDFYSRRMYGRIHDCWNRPIASAPDAWIDVLERTDISNTSGFGTELELKGSTRRALNLGSYNYLGFAAADEYCTPQVQETVRQCGVSSCSTRVEGGTSSVHIELEERVARFLGKPAAIVFGMGFATNSATIPALAGKGSLIMSDALNHASIVTGAKASGAKVKVFRHNDAAHLEQLLRHSIAEGQPRTHRPWRKIIIIIEGIYSMEGEVACLREIVEIKRKYRAYLYLDEAHSIGALGATGRGLCEHAGVDPADVDVLMGTFTKSFGSCGGYIAADAPVIDYLRRYSPAHCYAAAIAPGAAQQIISALALMTGEDGTDRGRRKIRQLHDNANYFRRRLREMGLDVLGDWNSPVMPIMLYNSGIMPSVSRMCLARHVAIVVVGFPACGLLLARTRVCISAAHTRQDLDYALAVMQYVVDRHGLSFRRQRQMQPVALLGLGSEHGAEGVQEPATPAGAGAGGRRSEARKSEVKKSEGKKSEGKKTGARGRPQVAHVHATGNGTVH